MQALSNPSGSKFQGRSSVPAYSGRPSSLNYYSSDVSQVNLSRNIYRVRIGDYRILFELEINKLGGSTTFIEYKLIDKIMLV
ncbi:MAG: hypothetical protein WCE94_02980 [Candidatus Methanoperedens sp.]